MWIPASKEWPAVLLPRQNQPDDQKNDGHDDGGKGPDWRVFVVVRRPCSSTFPPPVILTARSRSALWLSSSLLSPSVFMPSSARCAPNPPVRPRSCRATSSSANGSNGTPAGSRANIPHSSRRTMALPVATVPTPQSLVRWKGWKRPHKQQLATLQQPL